MRIRTTGLALAALAALTPATPARASLDQESMFQDDSMLLYSSCSNVASTLTRMRGLGVDRVRVSVLWRQIAPSPTSTTKPQFNASDPNAYPAEKWDRFDTLVRLAALRGVKVNFNVTSPVPDWAQRNRPRNLDLEDVWDPAPGPFGEFVRALGTRYAGGFVPPGAPGAQSSGAPQEEPKGEPPLIPPPFQRSGAQAEASAVAAECTDAARTEASRTALPRVDFWSIWNEPNQGAWLAPQWAEDLRKNGRLAETSPRLYRMLADNAYKGLVDSGHGNDTILIGELAPKGALARGATKAMKPLRFIRRLYCLNENYKPLTGGDAEAYGCPTNGQASSMVAEHPVLFKASGFGHHPYNFPKGPTLRSSDRDFAAISDTPRLLAALHRATAAWGQGRAGGVPVWFTEYGYQTFPDPFVGIPQRTQSAYLNQSDYLASRYPQVRSVAQFLLDDDKPVKGHATTSPSYWSTFQSGLVGLDGKEKAAYDTYKIPIYMPRRSGRRSTKLRIWGQVRLAENNRPQTVAIQYRTLGKGSNYSTLKVLTTTNPKGFVLTKLRFRRSGLVRLAWTAPGGRVVHYSRPLGIKIRGR